MYTYQIISFADKWGETYYGYIGDELNRFSQYSKKQFNRQGCRCREFHMDQHRQEKGIEYTAYTDPRTGEGMYVMVFERQGYYTNYILYELVTLAPRNRGH